MIYGAILRFSPEVIIHIAVLLMSLISALYLHERCKITLSKTFYYTSVFYIFRLL